MNKTYRLVFNRAKGLIQVVSELAKSTSKNTCTVAAPAQPDCGSPVLFARSLLALAVAGLFVAMPLSVQAQASVGGDGSSNGLAGSGGMSDYGGGTGGAGGSGQSDWISLGQGAFSIGGGGGGGAGSQSATPGNFAGGAGGTGGYSGATGGAGATSAGSLGSTGGSITTINAASPANYQGAGGGGGGATGFISTAGNDLPSAPISGGAGGVGGSTLSNPNPAYGGGGGGGGGGTGLILQSAFGGVSASIGYDVAGGNGGAGGDGNAALGAGSQYTNAGGGGGGGGGAGIFAQRFDVSNNPGITIQGGDGGAGGYGNGNGGTGGAGGAGMVMVPVSASTRLTNHGTILGGAGGTGGTTGGGSYYLNFLLLNTSQRSFSAGNGGAGGNAVSVLGAGQANINNNAGGVLQGGNGGVGGYSNSVNYAGNGGNGGAGGHGVEFGNANNFSQGGSVANYGTIQGGSGGAGGTATQSYYSSLVGVSGIGGAGGDGIRLTDVDTGYTVSISNAPQATITGGNGGDGAAVPGGANFFGGAGGNGGNGINVVAGQAGIHNYGLGIIQGGAGGHGASGYGGGNGGAGGAGVSVRSGYGSASITNDSGATINGGTGGNGAAGHSGIYLRGGNGGTGGAGVEFLTVNNTLDNQGSIQGGQGGAGGNDGFGGIGGAGVVANVQAGYAADITNTGSIRGGNAGAAGNYASRPGYAGDPSPLSVTTGTAGGAGVSGNGFTLTNDYNNSNALGAAVAGGAGGQGAAAVNGNTTGGTGGVGGAGVSGAGFTINNGYTGYYSSTLTGGAGGAGGAGPTGGSGGAGGAGVAIGAGQDSYVKNFGYGEINGGVGGTGGAGVSVGGAGGVGGAGVLINNSNGRGYIYNSWKVTGGNGGNGGTGALSGAGGSGGAGIEIRIGGRAGYIRNDANSYITGGNGGNGSVGGVGGAGILNNGAITTLNNNGSIYGGTGSAGATGGAGIENHGEITTLTNMGAIVGGGSSAGINNQSAIGTLINAQGGNANSAASTALTFTGVLQGLGGNGVPLDYQAYITDFTHYGQLSMQSLTGYLSFGIASGSNLDAITYANVLSGIGSNLISNYNSIYNRWTTFGAYRWELVNGTSCTPVSTCWDLAVAALPVPTDILSGQTYYTADLVSGSGAANVNPVFDGGTLVVSVPPSTGTVNIADGFTISNNGGTIDQNGQSVVFSGVISDAVNGTPGSLTLTNSGGITSNMVSLTATNTYTGSTTINAGAALALSGSGSIATSSGVIDNGMFDVSAVTLPGGAAIQSLSGTGSVNLGPRTLSLTNASGTFYGNLTGSGGRLVIASGSETLSGTNTHTGGIEVDAGAALSISSATNLGSGMLDLIGSSTTTATLNVLATTSINNTIRISGDPTFNIAGGTTTTIAAPIVDLGTPGDVVVTGSGTLNLTAANTYTGQTTVGNGATLALNGNGSIANSSGLTNNGSFNVAGATGNVSLSNFTQGSSGSLAMRFAPTGNQQINISGTASLGGGLTLNPVAGAYIAGRYTLLTAAGGVTGTFSNFSTGTLSSYTSLQYTLSYDANDVFLTLFRNGPSIQNTQQSVQNNATGLASAINLQSAGLQAGLQYDCSKFAENNLCISAGGRYTYAGAGAGAGAGPSANTEAGLVIVAYQPSANWRIGGFVDQSFNTSTPGNFKLSNNNPAWGLFGNWYMDKSREGLNVQAAVAFSNNKLTTTRSALTDSEPGQGSTTISGQGYQLQANYVQSLTDNLKVIPYLGLRYTQLTLGAYGEHGNSQVTSPLNYDQMTQRNLSALAGVGLSARLAERLGGNASVGIQKNVNYAMSNYSGSSQIAGLETFSARMPGRRDNLATASAGIYYDLGKNERVGLNVLWQQQPLVNTNTASAMVTYTLGL